MQLKRQQLAVNLDNHGLYVLILSMAQDNESFCSPLSIAALTVRTPLTCAINMNLRADEANNQLPKGLIFSLHMTKTRLSLDLQKN